MKIFKMAALLATFELWAVGSIVFAAAPGPDLLKARGEAEAKGFIFIAGHDEIVTKAKKEGQLRVLAEMEPPNIKASIAAFTRRYPFINLHIQEITGTDAARRFILELQAGRAKDWDIVNLSRDFLGDYLPYLERIDLLGMAEHGVLAIPPKMIDSRNRNIVAPLSRFVITAYNKNLLSAGQLPKSWEDFLKPDFKGRKFAADIRSREVAALVPAWGMEKTLDFARSVAAQQPIWARGGTRVITSIMAGEIPMMLGPYFHTLKRAQEKDVSGSLQYVIVEPVPILPALELAIRASAQHLNAALLWFEWMASPEAQKLADEHEPVSSSVYVRGGVVEQELRGKKLSVVSWEDQANFGGWQAKVFEAYGFPKAAGK